MFVNRCWWIQLFLFFWLSTNIGWSNLDPTEFDTFDFWPSFSKDGGIVCRILAEAVCHWDLPGTSTVLWLPSSPCWLTRAMPCSAPCSPRGHAEIGPWPWLIPSDRHWWDWDGLGSFFWFFFTLPISSISAISRLQERGQHRPWFVLGRSAHRSPCSKVGVASFLIHDVHEIFVQHSSRLTSEPGWKIELKKGWIWHPSNWYTDTPHLVLSIYFHRLRPHNGYLIMIHIQGFKDRYDPCRISWTLCNVGLPHDRFFPTMLRVKWWQWYH